MEPSRFNRALARLGEILLVGAMTCVASLGIVTIGAAFVAGTAALSEKDQPLMRTWLHTFRTRFAASLPLVGILLVVACVVIMDIGFSFSNAPSAARTASIGAGMGLALCTAAATPYAFAALTSRAPLRRSLTTAAACAGATPLRTLGLIALTLLLIVTPMISLLLAVPVAGSYCLAAATAHRVAMTRLSMRTRPNSH